MSETDDMRGQWRDILNAIENRVLKPALFFRYFIGGITHEGIFSATAKTKRPRCRKPRKKITSVQYFLGDTFGDAYLTVREADCMALLLGHHTNEQVAQQLNLSARTIEFYIKNMRQKLNCHSKMHLIETIRQTDFVHQVDDIKLRLTRDD